MTIKLAVEFMKGHDKYDYDTERFREALYTLIKYAESGVNEEEPLFMQAIHKNQKPKEYTSEEWLNDFLLSYFASNKEWTDVGHHYTKETYGRIRRLAKALVGRVPAQNMGLLQQKWVAKAKKYEEALEKIILNSTEKEVYDIAKQALEPKQEKKI